MNEADQAQRETAQAAGQVVGLAADLVGAAADAFRRTEQRQKGKGQDPSIPSLDDGDRDLQAKESVGAVLDSTPAVDFTKGQIPQDLGIPELKDVDPNKIAEFDRDIAVSWGFALSDVNRVNQSRKSIGADMQGYKESEAVQSIQDSRESLQKLIKDKGYTNEQLWKVAGYDHKPQRQEQSNGVGAVLEKIDNAPAVAPQKSQENNYNASAPQADGMKNKPQQTQQERDQYKAPELIAWENELRLKAQAARAAQSKSVDQPKSSVENIQPDVEQPSTVRSDSEVNLDESQYRDSLKSQGVNDEIIDGAIAEIKQSGESLDSQEPKNTQQAEKHSVQPPQEKTPKVDGVGSVGQQTTQKSAQPKPTASGPRQAKSEVKALGKSLETELKGILKANKVEARIYSGSQLVYPPKANTKISPEVSDKLNRAFSDPQSVKGTVTLSLRTEDGKLNPVYKVSNGKVVKDDYGLRKAIAHSLPESRKVDQSKQKTEAKAAQQPEAKPEAKATQKAEAKAEPQRSKQSVEQKPEPKAEQQPESKVEQKASAQAEQTANRQPDANSIERQNSINQNSPEPRVRRPTSDEVIGRQAQRIQDQQREIQSLKSELQKSQKLEAQLRKAKVPIGLITGIQNHANRLGNQIKGRVNSIQAKVAETARGAVNTVDKNLMRMETATVYRASSYLAKEHGKEQADGSRQFTVNNRFHINLKKDGNLTISRANEDKAIIFSGNQKESRFSKSATTNELNNVKSLPMAVGKIRHEQQKALQTQKQAVRQQNSKGVSRRR